MNTPDKNFDALASEESTTNKKALDITQYMIEKASKVQASNNPEVRAVAQRIIADAQFRASTVLALLDNKPSLAKEEASKTLQLIEEDNQ